MPPSPLEIPCKTAAGHAQLVMRDSLLTPWQQQVLRLVDGRRSTEEVTRMAALLGAPRSCLKQLERRGLVVKAARICLPGEAPERVSALTGARRLLMQALLGHLTVSSVLTRVRVYRARDVASLQHLIPAVKACQATDPQPHGARLIDEAEGLLRAG